MLQRQRPRGSKIDVPECRVGGHSHVHLMNEGGPNLSFWITQGGPDVVPESRPPLRADHRQSRGAAVRSPASCLPDLGALDKGWVTSRELEWRGQRGGPRRSWQQNHPVVRTPSSGKGGLRCISARVSQRAEPPCCRVVAMAAYSQTQYSPAIQSTGPYGPYTHHPQGYGVPSYNIKTEDGLSHSPGQNGLLGYPSNFSTAPPGQSLYSYSTHGSSISSGIFQGTNGIATSAPFNHSQQDFSAYSAYSQSQYSPYYSSHYNAPYLAASNVSPSAMAATIPYQHAEHLPVVTNHSPESLPGDHHPSPSPPTPSKEQDGVRARRGSDGKLRGRKRASDPAPPLDSDIEVSRGHPADSSASSAGPPAPPSRTVPGMPQVRRGVGQNTHPAATLFSPCLLKTEECRSLLPC
ncbi:hypothetical protein Z043_108947 [Scleropages formosus]|uniref:Eyes absent homolog n=1 Tax=Scleropages formosus TaxID=113540 RepID=A0A0P7XB62_SCLFO|nr:hypothetical protein Z043_108947 [Scleropages formosus]